MSDLISTLRAIVRDELARVRAPELGLVTEVHPKDADDSAGNHAVNVRLQATGLELHHVPVTVGVSGLSALPAVGELVLVLFVGGALNAPIVVGQVYSDQNRPPKGSAHEVVYVCPDPAESGVRRLHMELPSGTLLTLDDDVITIDAGGSTVIINREGDISVKAKGNLQLAADGDIEVKAGGALTLSAGGNVSIKGISSVVEGQADATLKGPQVKLAGITQFSAS